MAKTRAVGGDHSVRTRPMKLLCLGASRTGTSSLCVALSKLGYKTFHMNECLAQPRYFFPLWNAALDAKFFGKGRPYEKGDFDKILGDYDSVSDLPCALFADEFLEFYPDAKVILTERDPDKWIKSMQKTLYLVHSWSSWDLVKHWDPALTKLWRGCDLRDWDAWLGLGWASRRDFLSEEYGELAKQRLIEHSQHIKKVVPKEKLLVWKPQEGWEPLGKFLGQETPSEEFPHVWDAEALVRMAAMIWWIDFGKMLASIVVPVGLAVGGWYWLGPKQ
jgi:hypothetical protein